MIAVILCAGRGSRLGRKTSNIPKCMVKLKNKPLIDWSEKFRNNFKKKIFVCGYKKDMIIKNFDKDPKNIFVSNNKFKSTNMVYSLFKITKKHIKNEDIVVCYSDIIFNPKIFRLFKIKKTFIPIKLDWLKLWKKRMNLKEIKKDAENIQISGKFIKTIGENISEKLPDYQFMGLVKIKNNDFFKLKKFFKKMNKKIDFTTFLNKAISKKIINLSFKKTKTEWYEIDNQKDLRYAESVRIRW
jgi:hypothetical protein